LTSAATPTANLPPCVPVVPAVPAALARLARERRQSDTETACQALTRLDLIGLCAPDRSFVKGYVNTRGEYRGATSESPRLLSV